MLPLYEAAEAEIALRREEATELSQPTPPSPDPELIRTLNDLLMISRDAQHGYETAAGQLENETTAEICRQNGETRATHAQELVNAITGLGGEPVDIGDLTALVHRAWITIKGELSSDDLAVVSEIVRGEEQAVAAYQAALATALPDAVRRLVTQQAAAVKSDCANFKLLQSTLEAHDA